ncbi:MAG TPA: carboxylesterase family protein [Bryobacteraceae bacterium]|nr:carboxylesterase family protein [Bryobacteraceae bacterium]
MTLTVLSVLVLCAAATLPAMAGDRVKTANGVLESTTAPKQGVRSFKGIPFAAPPIGELRWREPQPVQNWTGVRNADKFGPACMQRLAPDADYWLRSDGMSEDCLYLNVWTPAKSANEKLPVLVYIFGGGFQNGDGSEPRYDGASMARHGIVAVSLNYRTNIFGFFAHPELTKESPHHASGNYGLLDQVAALEWVQRNIAAFGGDPKRVTIAGESAGSISVSALMASPLSKNLMAGAIGESGAMISSLPARPLSEAEQSGVKFGEAAGATTLAALRALTAQQIQDAQGKTRGIRFSSTLDGYFLTKPLLEVYEAGEQAHIPLLAGSNTEEGPPQMVLGNAEPTPENFEAAVRKAFGAKADDLLKAYQVHSSDEVLDAAMELASARFISYGTWLWTELQMKTGEPVYRYLYARVRPEYTGTPGREAPGPHHPSRGAVHSAEIQYAMGNLDIDPRYKWDEADHEVSKLMQSYFVNFVKTGNPNGAGLPHWPEYKPDSYERLRIDVTPKVEKEDRERYQAFGAARPTP